MMRVIKRRVCVSIATLLLALASAATGRTIYVDDDGSADFNNIQAAIDDANEAILSKFGPAHILAPVTATLILKAKQSL